MLDQRHSMPLEVIALADAASVVGLKDQSDEELFADMSEHNAVNDVPAEMVSAGSKML